MIKQQLSFDTLRTANVTRQVTEWDVDNRISLSYRGNELAGEVGEACNVIKKLDREMLGIVGSRDTKEHLAEELADVIICVDLIAAAMSIDLAHAVAAKFNATSDKNGFKTHIDISNNAVVVFDEYQEQ
jgi:NTP pyrophosphatase (non-canonical NTP hydrolase)